MHLYVFPIFFYVDQIILRLCVYSSSCQNNIIVDSKCQIVARHEMGQKIDNALEI